MCLGFVSLIVSSYLSLSPSFSILSFSLFSFFSNDGAQISFFCGAPSFASADAEAPLIEEVANLDSVQRLAQRRPLEGLRGCMCRCEGGSIGEEHCIDGTCLAKRLPWLRANSHHNPWRAALVWLQRGPFRSFLSPLSVVRPNVRSSGCTEAPCIYRVGKDYRAGIVCKFMLIDIS